MFEPIRRLLTLFTGRDKSWLVAILFTMFVVAVLELVSIGTVPIAISVVASPGGLERYPLPKSIVAWLKEATPQHLVVAAGLGFLVVYAIRTVFLVLSKYMQVHFAATRQARLSSTLLSAYLNAPYDFHLARDSSDLIQNLQAGAMLLGGQVILRILVALQSAILLLFILAALAIFHPAVTAVSLGLFGAFGIVFFRLTSGRARRWGKLEVRERKRSLRLLRQSLAGVREIRLLGRESYFGRRFHEQMRNVAGAQKRRELLTFLSSPLMEMLAVVSMSTVAALTMSRGRDLSYVSAVLGLFAMAFFRMKTSLTTLLGAATNLSYQLVWVDPVAGDLTALTRAEPPPAVGPERPHVAFQTAIRLEDVSFRYPGSNLSVLDHITLSIEKGSCLGFVGPTGSGKSTLATLLLGLLKPTSGRITVDGADIQADVRSWQRHVGYVPQDMFLINDSIRRNIALGEEDRNIDDDRVCEALNGAQLAKFVDSLPEGPHTFVGERGVRLSGGQKQRISIARALYHRRGILVLDEATAALDYTTEEKLMEAIRGLVGEMTIVIVAHRLRTLDICSLIYRLEEGRLTLVSGVDSDNWAKLARRAK